MKRVANAALNILLATSCVIISADAIHSFFVTRTVEAARRKAITPVEGTPFRLPGVDWSKNRNGTLVFGISKNCHYCTQSAPFYHRLVASAGSRVAMLAIAPEPVEDVREHLAKLDVEMPDIRQIVLAKVEIRGTPTLVFVNQRGIVEKVWKGALSSERELEVTTFLSRIAG